MTQVKLLFLEGYFSSSWLSACGKASVNVGQYVEITTARVPLSPLQACANNRLTMFFLQVGIAAGWRSPKWGVNSKSGQNLQNGAGSFRAKTFTIGSGFSQLLLTYVRIFSAN